MSILSDLLGGIVGTYSDAWREMGSNPDTMWVAAPFALAVGSGLMRKAWSHIRSAMRPLPRPGVVLVESFGRPGDTSGLPELCDCDAPTGTPPGEKHRGPGTWKAACLSYRQDWTTRPPDRPNPDAALFALNALGSKMLEEARTSAARREIAEQVVAESSWQSCGMAVPRPEMGVVLRPPLLPSRPFCRPAPTPIPSGGKRQSG